MGSRLNVVNPTHLGHSPEVSFTLVLLGLQACLFSQMFLSRCEVKLCNFCSIQFYELPFSSLTVLCRIKQLHNWLWMRKKTITSRRTLYRNNLLGRRRLKCAYLNTEAWGKKSARTNTFLFQRNFTVPQNLNLKTGKVKE